jgi:hypothetical protein
VYDDSAPNIGVGIQFSTQYGAEEFEKAILNIKLPSDFAWSQPSSSGRIYDVVDARIEHKQYKAVSYIATEHHGDFQISTSSTAILTMPVMTLRSVSSSPEFTALITYQPTSISFIILKVLSRSPTATRKRRKRLSSLTTNLWLARFSALSLHCTTCFTLGVFNPSRQKANHSSAFKG